MFDQIDEIHDKMMDKVYGSKLSRLGGNAKFTDIMNCDIREDLDVEELLDCEGREDFLELNQLIRIYDMMDDLECEVLKGNL